MKKLVRDLSVGDILSSGCEVIEAPFDSCNCPVGKCNIGIRYKSGTTTIRQWNKRTEVTVKVKHVYRDPGMPQQQPSRSPDFDYWGMSRL